jgi:hypothetical protein
MSNVTDINVFRSKNQKPKMATIRYVHPVLGVQIKDMPFTSYRELIKDLPEGAIIVRSRVN